MNNLSTLCSHGGTGRRKGLKIRSLISQEWLKPQFSLFNWCLLREAKAIVNLLDRPNFVTGIKI
jgi:hypothetical protein